MLARFISYYPFNETGVASENETLLIETLSDQSTNENYGLSDFMTAKTENITPSNNAVLLDFMHRLSKINFIIQSINEEDIDEIVNNCDVTINGVYCMADYNLETNEITNLSSVNQIEPNGMWSVTASNKIVGKKAIVIPQNISQASIIMQVGDRVFSCNFPDLDLSSGISYNITLKYDSSMGINGLTHQISDWVEDDADYEMDLEEDFGYNGLSIRKIDFEVSSIYEVKDADDKRLGIICKEYLFNTDIDKVALVYYSDKTPLRGNVLEVLGVSSNIHGGIVEWNVDSNSFVYTNGERAKISNLCLDANGEIINKISENSPIISAEPNMLVDIRGDETITYPTVKIGKQIWQRENLKTTLYTDGNKMTNNTSNLNIATAGYYVRDNNYFYNTALICQNNIAPEGWVIPTFDQWQLLIDYVNNASAKLKAGDGWAVKDGITYGNNIAGFNGQCVGGFFATQLPFAPIADNTFALYWRMNNERSNYYETGVALNGNSNEVKGINVYLSCAFAIRLIKN